MAKIAEIVRFKAFCLERYKFTHNLSGRETLRLFKQHGVMDYLSSAYDLLHSFGEQRIVADIHEFISN